VSQFCLEESSRAYVVWADEEEMVDGFADPACAVGAVWGGRSFHPVEDGVEWDVPCP
jgi:hypothetical protein